MKAKLGFICSSGGSPVRFLINEMRSIAPDVDFFVAVDRRCGMHDYCEENGINFALIDSRSNADFSAQAKKYFVDENEVDFVVLLFSRLITSDLFDHVLCMNVHPAILPAFPGIVNSAAKLDKAKLMGATLHLVDAGVDTGRVLAQVSCWAPEDLSLYDRFSYFTKSYLLLVLVDYYLSGDFRVDSPDVFLNARRKTFANPALKEPVFIKSFQGLLIREGHGSLYE